MFGIGFFEIVVIVVIAIVFIGPERLPEFMRKAGRLYVQMRRMTNEVRSTFNNAMYEVEEEIRREKTAALKKLLDEHREIESKEGGTAAPSEERPALTPESAELKDEVHTAQRSIGQFGMEASASPAVGQFEATSQPQTEAPGVEKSPMGDERASEKKIPDSSA